MKFLAVIAGRGNRPVPELGIPEFEGINNSFLEKRAKCNVSYMNRHPLPRYLQKSSELGVSFLLRGDKITFLLNILRESA